MRTLSVRVMAMALLASPVVVQPAWTQAQTPALTGKVISDPEGPMEGVLVSARKSGAAITVTVVSDAKGEYSFPVSRLDPGRYALTIRAAGYALDGVADIDIAQGRPTVGISSSSRLPRAPTRSPTPNGS